MKRTFLLLGAVVVVAACDQKAPTAPVSFSPAKANECIWIRLGDSEDSTLVCP